MSWSAKFREVLPLLGHRNWVLVVDKAFPMQSAAGMTIMDSGEALPEVLSSVLSDIASASHVKPVIYTDRELDALDESFCTGIEALRQQIYSAIESYAEDGYSSIMHEEVFAKLDAASKLFNVVVIKTEAVLPYTSVFIELDCGYWSAAQEATLRSRL